MTTIRVLQNFLELEEQKYVIKQTFSNNKWSFSGVSNEGSSNLFWYMNLEDNKFFTEFMFNKIKNIILEDVELTKVYANGQTYGLSGELHTDSDLPNFKTFLYYPSPMWKTEWGGFTVFDLGNKVETVFPYPNSAVYFDANIPHYGLEPSKHCPFLRVSIAFKLRLKQ